MVQSHPRAPATFCNGLFHALVAQLDRAPAYEAGGRRFESFRARQNFTVSLSTRRLAETVMILPICVRRMFFP